MLLVCLYVWCLLPLGRVNEWGGLEGELKKGGRK